MSQMDATAGNAASSSGAPVFCHATLNYLSREPAAEPGQAVRPTEVAIHDGRQARLPGWPECGFELMRHESTVENFDDEEQVAEVHYPEISRLAQALTGCDHALVASHINRNPEQAARHSDLGPIAFVHSDFAASYGELIRNNYRQPSEQARRALDRAGVRADDVVSAPRLLILQFWRNTGEPRMDLPLAFCDVRTVPADDLRAIPVKDYAGGGFDFEALAVIAPEAGERHAWYAYPDMTRDEIVAFRTYDSDLVRSGGRFWTPHSAFTDSRVTPGHPARRSIELRATCLFL